jgi:predicted nucleotidyltransferase
VIQQEFATKAKQILEKDKEVIGLAVGGSWLTNEIDEYSDLDLILVTKKKVSDDKNKMLEFAERMGDFLSGFTGEHVGEPRVLICLYDKPLLHVDIKFLTLAELDHRVETPHILFDRDGEIKAAFEQSKEKFPVPDYQWIEDRFWTWVHYTLLKIGRGEYFEAFDFFGFLRMVVFGPLLHIKNGNLPRAVRKVEVELNENDFADLKTTIPEYEKKSLLKSLRNSVKLYRNLRESLFDESIKRQSETEKKVMEYFEIIEKQNG